MDNCENGVNFEAKCIALEKKCLLLEQQLSEQKHKTSLWRDKYFHVKKNVKFMPKTYICKFCGQTYTKEQNGWQNHFMFVCPHVKNACQRLLNSHLLAENLEKKPQNIDSVLRSVTQASVQLVDLKLLPEFKLCSNISNDNTTEEIRGFDEVCANVSIPETAQTSIQLIDLKRLPQYQYCSNKSYDNTEEECFDEVCDYDSIPEVSVEIEISMTSGELYSDSTNNNVISIGF